MACLIVPGTEALIVTAVALVLEKSSKAKVEDAKLAKAMADHSADHVPFHRHLMRLAKLLWGGTALLALEHWWHGEIQFHYPFLTAAGDPEAMSVVYQEMATVGVSMALFVTAIWAVHLIFLKAKANEKNLAKVKE